MPDAPPESISVYAINSTTIFMAWQPPPEDVHNGIIQSYLINCTEVDTGMSFNVSSNFTEIIISSLHPAYFYTCQVSAVTIDVGVFSENITVQTLEAGMYLSIHCNALVTFILLFFIQHPVVLLSI